MPGPEMSTTETLAVVMGLLVGYWLISRLVTGPTPGAERSEGTDEPPSAIVCASRTTGRAPNPNMPTTMIICRFVRMRLALHTPWPHR